MSEDCREEVKFQLIERNKLKNSVSRKFIQLLCEVRYNSYPMRADAMEEDTAFEDALRYVAALENGLYPQELEKRQQLVGMLHRLLDDAAEMRQMLMLMMHKRDLDAIAPTYERDREMSLALLNKLEAETTRTISIRWGHPLDAEMELHRFALEAKDGNIVERFVDSTTINESEEDPAD